MIDDRKTMKIEAKYVVQDGVLTLDMCDLFSVLDDESKRDVAKMLAFDEEIVTAMCRWLTNGEVDRGDGDPWYITYCDGRVMEKAREALMPLMDTVSKAFIADLIRERDSAVQMRNRWRNFCWELERKWNDEKRPESSTKNMDYSQPKRLSQAQVTAIMQAREDKDKLSHQRTESDSLTMNDSLFIVVREQLDNWRYRFNIGAEPLNKASMDVVKALYALMKHTTGQLEGEHRIDSPGLNKMEDEDYEK